MEKKPVLESDPMISRVISMMDSDNLSSGSASEGEERKKTQIVLKRKIVESSSEDEDFFEEARKAREKRATRIKPRTPTTQLGAPAGKPGDGTLDRILKEAAAANDSEGHGGFGDFAMVLVKRGVHKGIREVLSEVSISRQGDVKCDYTYLREVSMHNLHVRDDRKEVFVMQTLEGRCETDRAILKLERVAGDGKCSFHAIAVIAGKPGVSAKEICDEIKASERYEAVEEAWGNVANPENEWGSIGTMVLAAWVYEMDVCSVYSLGGRP